MKIDAIDLYRVHMPLVYPFRTAFGNDETIESVLVRFHAGDICGWGETTPWSQPGYSSEWAAGVFLLLRDVLGPRVVSHSFDTAQALQQTLACVKGNPFAKAGLDLAWWDLAARLEGKPLWQLLGGTNPLVDVGADFGVMESVDALLDAIGGARRTGYKRIKLKYRPGWDLDMITAVRDAFPDSVFHIDCNSAYSLDDVDMFKELDRFNLKMIEQPLAHDDLIDHAALQAQIRTPICLDESITSVAKARKAIALNACRWVNIKPGRVGGITPALAIHDLCRAEGIPCWVGGMLESSVGGHHCLALGTLPNMQYPSDIFPSKRFYTEDLSDPPLALTGPSEIAAPTTPGVGAEPNPARLAQACLDSASLP